jgi:hypothetical protein
VCPTVSLFPSRKRLPLVRSQSREFGRLFRRWHSGASASGDTRKEPNGFISHQNQWHGCGDHCLPSAELAERYQYCESITDTI